MHKFTLPGLLALILAVFSSSVSADRAAWCDDLKAEYKGLHGLCNAYWNETDEALRAEILFNFYEKAPAGVVMPEPPDSGEVPPPTLDCPCWASVALNDIDAVTAPDFCFVGDSTYAFFGTEPHVQSFITNGSGCVYDADYLDGDESVTVTVLIEDLGAAGEICLSEMTDILNMYFPDGNGGANCFGSQ